MLQSNHNGKPKWNPHDICSIQHDNWWLILTLYNFINLLNAWIPALVATLCSYFKRYIYIYKIYYIHILYTLVCYPSLACSSRLVRDRWMFRSPCMLPFPLVLIAEVVEQAILSMDIDYDVQLIYLYRYRLKQKGHKEAYNTCTYMVPYCSV